ncbi:MAG: PepSY-associated TM helix domain-containing protein [Fulvivirga sp.]
MRFSKIFNKDTLFKIHGWVGIKLSIVFFVVCFSGTLAVFSHEMDWLFNADMRAAPKDNYASRNQAVKNIQAIFPNGKITYWERAREPYLTDIVYVKSAEELKYVFVNPYTAEVQGFAAVTIQRFFRDLHYYLFIPDQVGNYLVLFFGFVLVISLITGMFYYSEWYKKLFVLKVGKGSQAFYSSLHKLVGAWSIPFMIVIGATSLWYFAERSDFPRISPQLQVAVPAIMAPKDSTWSAMELDYDRFVTIAEKAIPGLVVKDIIPPAASDRPVYLTGTSHVPLVRHRANRVYIDPHSYEVVKVQKADEINTTTWLNDIADPLHFGYWGGLVTKVIYFIFGAGLSSLILTGPWLYIKRRLKVKRLARERRLVHG